MAPTTSKQLRQRYRDEYEGMRSRGMPEAEITAALRECDDDPEYRTAFGQSSPVTSPKVVAASSSSQVVTEVTEPLPEKRGRKNRKRVAESVSPEGSPRETSPRKARKSQSPSLRGKSPSRLARTKRFLTTLRLGELPARMRVQVVRYMAAVARRKNCVKFVKAVRCPRRNNETAVEDMQEAERTEPERELDNDPEEKKRSRRQRKAEAQMLAAAKRGNNPVAGSIGVLRNSPDWHMPRKYVALRVEGGEKRVKKTAMKLALSVDGLRGKTAVQGHTVRGSVAVSVKSIDSVMQGGTEADAALDVARHKAVTACAAYQLLSTLHKDSD